MDKKNPRTGSRNKEDLREWKNLDNSSRQGYDQQGLSANLQRNDDPKIQSVYLTVESSIALVIELILVAVPEGTANRQILGISYIATQTRKSLVKGERFIRAVWMTESWFVSGNHE